MMFKPISDCEMQIKATNYAQANESASSKGLWGRGQQHNYLGVFRTVAIQTKLPHTCEAAALPSDMDPEKLSHTWVHLSQRATGIKMNTRAEESQDSQQNKLSVKERHKPQSVLFLFW